MSCFCSGRCSPVVPAVPASTMTGHSPSTLHMSTATNMRIGFPPLHRSGVYGYYTRRLPDALPEPLPQERLALLAQLPVRALDLPEELGEFLVARVLGVLEGGRARVRPLEGMIEDADDIVMLI